MKNYLKLLCVYIVVTSTVAGAQSFNEVEVTMQARAFGPKSLDANKGGDVPNSTLQWVVDRLAINDVLTRYTRGLDRHDKLLIASAFWPDAQINYGDTFTGLRDEFVHWSIVDDKKRFSAHTHNITNQTVEFDGDIAHAETYLVGVEHRHEGKVQVVGGRYIDKLERRNDEWRIVLREFLVDTVGMADGTAFTPFKTCRSACGSMDKTDRSYDRPLQPRAMSTDKK